MDHTSLNNLIVIVTDTPDVSDLSDHGIRVSMQRSTECEGLIEERLLVAYKRIRKNARNGLAVVGINRDACGGCFNKIPPQHQLDICTHKKIIVCEYCGRILVDKAIIDRYQE